MRVSRTMISIVVASLAALVYVHQQVELVKMSYSIGIKEKKVKEMLDRKEGLVYNIDNLESPSRLEGILSSQNVNVSFPGRAHVVKMAGPGYAGMREHIRPLAVEGKINPIAGLLDFLSPKAEARGLKEK